MSDKETVTVPRVALAQLLNALHQPGYILREMQAISAISPNCPIKALEAALKDGS